MRNTDLTFNRVSKAVKPKAGIFPTSTTVAKGKVKSRVVAGGQYTYEVDLSGDGNTLFGVGAIGVTQPILAGTEVEVIQTYDGGIFIIGARTHPMQNGLDTFSFANVAAVNRTVVFPATFAVAPHIQLTVEAGSGFTLFVISGTRTTTQFQYQAFTWNAVNFTGSITVHWTAKEI